MKSNIWCVFGIGNGLFGILDAVAVSGILGAVFERYSGSLAQYQIGFYAQCQNDNNSLR